MKAIARRLTRAFARRRGQFRRRQWLRPANPAFARQAFAGIALVGAALFAGWLMLPPDEQRLRSAGRGLTILSAEGNELRRFREGVSGSYTRHGQDLQAYSPALIEAVLRAEDRRFYYHPGFDPAAILRAALQNLQAGRIISGGSTITQQLVRLLYRSELPRDAYLRKIAELLLALRLELHTTKDEILLAYLNRVPLPGNRSGIAAGSEYLFGRDPRFLTREESLALAILIRHNYPGPESFRRRYRRLAALLPNSNLTAAATAESSRTDEAQVKANRDPHASEVPDDLVRRIFARTATRELDEPRGERARPARTPGHSPHFTDWLRSQFPDLNGVVRTRLSENENESIQNILHGELDALAKLNARHAAVVVLRIDRESGRLILEGLVGSRDYDDPSGGQINGATTRRVAGSTLKPFIYGLAFEEQSLRPYSIVYDDDSNVSLGGGATYRPRNYDLNYWGAMTAREALATSRNIPAVKLTERLGEERVFEFLGRAGFFPVPEQTRGRDRSVIHANPGRIEIEADPYAFGPGIALGISGATLLDLARAYSAFAADGDQYPVLIGEREDGRQLLYGANDRLFSEQTAHRITHILSDRSMRRRAFGERSFLDFPFDVAAKTGTSKDYRDAWTVGYSRRYVVAVWVGNFNATPMKNVSGAHGAGRIFHQVMRGLHRRQKPRFQYPEDWRRVAICRHTGLAAAETCEHFSELIPSEEVTPVQCHGEHASDSFTSRDAGSLANRSADSLVSREPGDDSADFAFDTNSGDTQNSTAGGRRHLLSPTPGAVYYLDPHAPRKIQEIPLRLHLHGRGGGLLLELPAQAVGAPRSCRPPGCPATLALDPGEYEIRVLREGREIERVEFSVR